MASAEGANGQARHTLDSTDKPYARDKEGWDEYLKGRPQAPDTFFQRIYKYHEEHGGQLDVVHDAGAGVSPWSGKLREKFKRVLVSDIVPENVKQAEQRLGNDGFSYRAAKLEDASGLEPASVDLFFASTCMHFCDLELAQEAIAKQLRPGGTFVSAGFGVAKFVDPDVSDIFTRLLEEGARVLYRRFTSPEAARKRLRGIGRTGSGYGCALTSEKHLRPGALRITLASPVPDGQGWVKLLPEDIKSLLPNEPPSAGPNDVCCVEEMKGWMVETDLAGMKLQFSTLAFAEQEPGAYESTWRDMEAVMKGGRVVKGWYPAKLIMATRK